MKNTLNQGFSKLYAENSKYLPPIEFKTGVGDFKRALEATTDQIVDIDPITTSQLDDPSSSTTSLPNSEPTVTEDTPTNGEIIIADNDDEVSITAVDGTPAGANISNEALDLAGLPSFSIVNPVMDDFLGEIEGTTEEDKKDEEKHPAEVATEKLCNFLLNDPLNAANIAHMEEASTVLSKAFSKVYADLKYKLKPVADRLTNEVQDSVHDLLDMNGTTAVAKALQVEPPVLQQLDWSVLNKLGTDTDIIADAKKAGHIHVTNVMTFTAARATTARWLQEIETVNLPSSVKDKIISRVEVETGESPIEAADIDVSTNPDTPEGQVAAGESFLRSVLTSGNINTDGAVTADTPEDKQTYAHDPEEAFKEAKETFNLLYTDRKLSGGVRAGSDNIYNKYINLLTKLQDVQHYGLLNSTKLAMLETRVDIKYLPLNKITVLDKSDTYKLLDYFKSHRLQYKDLAVKLKSVQNKDESYLRAVAILAEELNKSLAKVFNTNYVHPVSGLEALHKTMQSVVPSKTNWSLEDAGHLQKQAELFEMYASYMKDLEQIYKAPKLGSKEANKIFDYGYYTLETGIAMLAMTEALALSGLSQLTQSYIQGLKNTAEKKGIEGLLKPRLDDFMAEEEDQELKGDNKNALDEEVDSENGVESLLLHLRDGQEGIFTKIKDSLARTFKFTSTKYKEMSSVDLKNYAKVKPAQLDTATFTFYKKDAALKMINNVMQGKAVIANFLKAVEIAAKQNAWPANADTAATSLTKLMDKTFGPGSYAYEDVRSVIMNDSMEEESTAVKSGYTLADIKKLSEIKQFMDSTLIPFVNRTFELDPHLPSAENRATLRNGLNAVLGLFLGFDYVVAEFTKSLYIVFQLHNRVLNESATESIARDVFNTISTQTGYYNFIRNVTNCMHAGDTGRKIHPLLKIVDKYPKLVDAYARMDFGISDNDTAILKKNANNLKGILSCIGLYLTVCKNYFHDNQVLILDEHTVNPSVMHEFYRQDGKNTDIEMHLLHQYILPKRPVPNMGIRINDVVRSAKRIADEYDRKVASMKEKLKIDRDGALQAVYVRVLDKYLKDTPTEKLPTGMTLKNFVATNFGLVNITAKNLLAKNHSVDECIMKFLIDLWYHDKPIYKDMYNKFEYRYRQLADTSVGELSLKDRATADAKVVADMTMNFLFDQFVQK